MGWRRLGMYLLMRLTRLSGTAHTIALGFACGAAISFTPFVGLHIALAVLLAWLFRGHLIAAVVGTVVGNPWTFPFIWLATYKLGQMMLGSGEAASWPAVTLFKHVMVDLGELVWPALTGNVSWEALKEVLIDLRALIWPMTIGSIPLALLAGLVTYFPLVRAINAFQETRQRRRAKRALQHKKRTPLAPAPNPPSETCVG